MTNGHIAQELSLRRNPVGQLGFHVQPDGIITQVENMGLAWHAGLRQGARLVEICKVAVSTLSHDQMVDLLKTSILVTVTVIPPLPDGNPRKGCNLQNCRYTGNFEGDYENLDEPKSPKKNAQLQQPVAGHRRRYDRSFSPPRSSNSSGYDTGSSSKSFGHDRFPIEGTITSSSSGHSSDDRWYELLENNDYDIKNGTPPPLPNRFNKRLNDLNQNHHNHNHQIQPLHNKVQVSHSLPLPHANFSLPLNNANYSDYESLKDNNRPLPRTANIEYLVTRQPKFENEETNSLNDKNILAISEDELSNGSGNVSPRLRRSSKQRGGQLTPSSNNNSRNHSPRTITETRLRPGVTPRSNRNSANLSSSTLQEDLMKLINPDYEIEKENGKESIEYDRIRNFNDNDNNYLITDNRPKDNETYISRKETNYLIDNNLNDNNDSRNYIIDRVRSTDTCFIDRTKNEPVYIERHNEPHIINNRSRSRENLNSLTLNSPIQEVIFTMARPATVISNPSTASSPAPSENKHSKEERASPRVINKGNNENDWPTSLENATRDMLRINDNLEGITDDRLGIDASITST